MKCGGEPVIVERAAPIAAPAAAAVAAADGAQLLLQLLQLR